MREKAVQEAAMEALTFPFLLSPRAPSKVGQKGDHSGGNATYLKENLEG